ncbi:BTB/POZ and MATH domain-containing protein 4 [Glycine soja]|nr:BTB/POZ and MATH domain-containing protein 4 [Glycine soja]
MGLTLSKAVAACGYWGYKRFYKRRQLEASTFLKDDCLKINCTVGVLVSSIDSNKLNTIQVPESDTRAQFGILLENEEFFYVTFLVGGERFHANNLVLAARSTMFQTEFFNGMEKDDHDSVAYILPIVDCYRAAELKSMCQKFSVQNLRAVMQSDGLKYLRQNYPLLQFELVRTVECKTTNPGKWRPGKSKLKVLSLVRSVIDISQFSLLLAP